MQVRGHHQVECYSSVFLYTRAPVHELIGGRGRVKTHFGTMNGPIGAPHVVQLIAQRSKGRKVISAGERDHCSTGPTVQPAHR